MKYFSVLMPLFLGCLAISAQDIGIDNTAKYLGNGQYSWTVFATGDAKALAGIDKVQYTLHPTFTNPIVYGKGANFSYSATGWGEFNIVAKIFYKQKGKPPATVTHWLRLFPQSKAPVQQQKAAPQVQQRVVK